MGIWQGIWIICNGAFERLSVGAGVGAEARVVRPYLFLIAIVNVTKRSAALLKRVILITVKSSNCFGDMVAGIGYRELGRMTAFDVEAVAQSGLWPLALEKSLAKALQDVP